MLKLDNVRTEIDSSQGIVVAVDGVSLEIKTGETFALVGESGSGKSVTALSIARLLPENACIPAGSVQLDDIDLVDLPEHEMRKVRGRRVSMIFQEPATSLNPVLTVGMQIIEVIEAHTPLRGKAARTRAIEWLRRVGIPEPERRIDTYPFQMSGGQKQRVMIAIALAAEPELLIADEPTTALDVTVQKQILDLLLDLQRERHMAILLITHDLGVARERADDVIVMYAGRAVEAGGVDDVLVPAVKAKATAASQVVEMRETAAGKKQAANESLDKTAMPPISAALAAASLSPGRYVLVVGSLAAQGEVRHLGMFDDRKAEGAGADQRRAHERRIRDWAPVVGEGNRAGGGKLCERRKCRPGAIARCGADREQPHPATRAIDARQRLEDLSAIGGRVAVRHEADRAESTMRGGTLPARRIFRCRCTWLAKVRVQVVERREEQIGWIASFRFAAFAESCGRRIHAVAPVLRAVGQPGLERLLGASFDHVQQIGRASCRERV